MFTPLLVSVTAHCILSALFHAGQEPAYRMFIFLSPSLKPLHLILSFHHWSSELHTGSGCPASVTTAHLWVVASLPVCEFCAASHPQRGTVGLTHASPPQQELIHPARLHPPSDDPSVTHLQLIVLVFFFPPPHCRHNMSVRKLSEYCALFV